MTKEKGLPESAGANTRLTHLGSHPENLHGFVNPPVVRGSTVLFPDYDTMVTERQRYTYGTHGTPTTDALCEALNALEGAAGTIIVPAGLAAITLTFMAYLRPGDHALIVDSVYGPTRRFCNRVLAKQFGIEIEYYDPLAGAGIEALMKPNTRLVHLESPGSNTMEIQDTGAISAVARRHGAVVTMDNTWATPLYFRPLDHGVDVSIHATTKYPAGHSDILMGTVSANADRWPKLEQMNRLYGICGAPEDSYLVLRGLRTMGVRLDHHQKSALEIAKWLEGHDLVSRVLHPALPSFPGHALWKRDFKGASGVFSFVLKAERAEDFAPRARAFLDALALFGLGYSWGGYESLAVPVNLGDRTIAAAPKEGPVIRLQIGLENIEDLQKDIERGFEAVRAL